MMCRRSVPWTTLTEAKAKGWTVVDMKQDGERRSLDVPPSQTTYIRGSHLECALFCRVSKHVIGFRDLVHRDAMKSPA
jgi:hypothetical protein